MPTWIFPSMFVAAVLHVVEEYYLPGGFLEFVRRLGSPIGPQLTAPMAVLVNGLFLALASLAALLWRDYPVLSLSVAGLMLTNSLVHAAASLRAKKYAPGLITAVVIYVPLASVAFVKAAAYGIVSTAGLIVAGGLGIAYHLLLFALLWLRSLRSNGAAA